MSEITQILSAGDPRAAAQLLPLVYDELRKLAAGHMANEPSGHTLDATALVHEAYLRLVPSSARTGEQQFANRAHFFAAAADAMRRILPIRGSTSTKRLTALDGVGAAAAQLAKLRIFGGLSVEEAGDALSLPRASAFRVWTYARAWLTAALADRSP